MDGFTHQSRTSSFPLPNASIERQLKCLKFALTCDTEGEQKKEPLESSRQGTSEEVALVPVGWLEEKEPSGCYRPTSKDEGEISFKTK